MPRIPDYNWHVMPQAPHIRRDVRYSAESFGAGDWAQAAGLARAAGNFGDALTNIGLNEMRKEQAEQEKAAAEQEREAKKAAAAAEREAESQARTTALTAVNEGNDNFQTLLLQYQDHLGQKAVDAQQEFFDKGLAVKQAMLERANGEPRTYRRLVAEAEREHASYVRAVTAWGHKQKGVVEVQALEGAVVTAEKRFGMSLREAGDYGELDRDFDEFGMAANAMLERKGDGDPALRGAKVEGLAQAMLRRQIEAAMFDERFEQAQGLLDHFRDKLAPADRAKLEAAIKEDRFNARLPGMAAQALEMEETPTLAAYKIVNGEGDFKKLTEGMEPAQRERLAAATMHEAQRRAAAKKAIDDKNEAIYDGLYRQNGREPTPKELVAAGADKGWRPTVEAQDRAMKQLNKAQANSGAAQNAMENMWVSFNALGDADKEKFDWAGYLRQAGIPLSSPFATKMRNEIAAAKERIAKHDETDIMKVVNQLGPEYGIPVDRLNKDGVYDEETVAMRRVKERIAGDILWQKTHGGKGLGPKEIEDLARERLAELAVEGEIENPRNWVYDPDRTLQGAQGESDRRWWRPGTRPAGVPAGADYRLGDFWWDQASRKAWTAGGSSIPVRFPKNGGMAVFRVNGRYYAVSPKNGDIMERGDNPVAPAGRRGRQ